MYDKKMRSGDDLKSKLLFGFFAFVCGALVTSLIQGKRPDSENNGRLFTLFEKSYSLKELPQELAEQLEKHIDETDEKTRRLLHIAAWHALSAEAESNSEKSRAFRDFLAPQAATREEIGRFWERNKSHINKPFYQARPQIRHHIEREKIQRNLSKTIEALVNSGELEFNDSLYHGSPGHQLPQAY
ncbi:MAG: hypothetical protein CSA52_01780 [Gammaproteobacteria bacterium]|nr:MAG: hypothetical protein CSB48_01485 [Pseudomonadota bacterium]PIE38591.1 MAG: hypothetical protein CSA52_01780 [Gammaproteobacteria bacterium]